MCQTGAVKISRAGREQWLWVGDPLICGVMREGFSVKSSSANPQMKWRTSHAGSYRRSEDSHGKGRCRRPGTGGCPLSQVARARPTGLRPAAAALSEMARRRRTVRGDIRYKRFMDFLWEGWCRKIRHILGRLVFLKISEKWNVGDQ